MTEAGHGMQVVEVLADHSYRLNEGLLQQLLGKEEVRELPVVVVSVAGAYRGGKSFLLNFLLRYLTSPISARSDGSWMGADNEPLRGFDWRGGIARNTTGILFWSEPFINTLPNGEKVAVILMDTQGTFDSQSTVRDNSTIFALSTLLSSVQLYNLSMNIKEDDLQHLQLFTMYGKMVQEKDHVGKAFQTLEFLVRDWPYPEDYAYGADGGNQLLQQRLEISPNQPQELKELRIHLNSCFEKLLCFLLPHPGFKVSRRAFKGNLNDIEPEFRTHLKDMVTSLLSPEKLCPKTINGQRIKAGELLTYFKGYMTLFNSDEIPSPRSILQVTAEAGLLTATNAARSTYERGMEAVCGAKEPGVSPADLLAAHELHAAAARAAFTSKRTMATQEEVNKHLNQLNTELANRLQQYDQANLSKLQAAMKKASDSYDQAMRNLTKGQPLCLNPLDLEALQRDAAQAALGIYDGSVKKISGKPDQKRAELTQSFAANLASMTATNEQNNRNAIKGIHSEYWKKLSAMHVNPPLSGAEFNRGHVAARSEALAKFQAKRNRPSAFPTDVFLEDLSKTINDTYMQLHAINLKNIEKENQRQEQERQRIENVRKEAEKERARMEQERKKYEQELARIQREKDAVEEKKRQEAAEIERKRQEEEQAKRDLEQFMHDKFGCNVH